MIEKLKELKTLLGQDELILTGSTALALHGLMDLQQCKDLDLLLVNPSATSTEVLTRLQTANPSKKHHNASPVTYSFIFQNVKVDIWVVPTLAETSSLQTKDGISVSTIKSIIAAKLGYNRAKDWVQLMKISKGIFDPKKFEDIIQSIKTETDEYDDED